ncbi:MAG: sensor histidine kinase [Solirubrobacteraceae bacterium]
MRSDSRHRLDVALVVTGVAGLILEAVAGHHSVALAVPLALLTCLPWLGRERYPLPTLLLTAAGLIACVLVLRAYDVASIAAAALLFFVALDGDRRKSLVVGTVSTVVLALLVVALIPVIERSDDLSGAGTRVLAVLAALVAGDLVRSRGALRAAKREQAASEVRELRDRVDRQAAAERLRIARELHDTLAHALVAINVRAGVTAHLGASPDATAAFNEIKDVSAQALTDLRATLDVLRDRETPAPRDPALGLEAVPRLVQRAQAAGLHAQAELELGGTAIPSVVDQAGFRIVQESLTNVMRHAHASQARVRIAAQAGELLIEITDDGQGAPGGEHAGGHGLRGMSERAAAVGGRVAAGPLGGRGWQVRATLPLGVEQP